MIHIFFFALVCITYCDINMNTIQLQTFVEVNIIQLLSFDEVNVWIY